MERPVLPSNFGNSEDKNFDDFWHVKTARHACFSEKKNTNEFQCYTVTSAHSHLFTSKLRHRMVKCALLSWINLYLFGLHVF